MEREYSSPAKILVVDDDPLVLETMKDLLETEGFQPLLSSRADEGLEIIKREVPELVITDIKMPGTSGLEFIRLIRKISAELPVIIITGFASLESAIEAIHTGAYDYIIKPFEVEKIIAIIHRAIKERRLKEKNKALLHDLQETTRELNKRLEQFSHLDKMSKIICSDFELEEFLYDLLNSTTLAVNAKIGSLMLWDDKEEYLLMKAVKGWNQALGETLRIKKGEGIPGLAVEKARIISHEDMEREGFNLGKIDREIYQSPHFISIPIYGKNRVWGVLNLSGWEEKISFTEVDLRLLSILVSQAWVALENSKLHGELQNSYLHTLQVLASAIEAKCRYTRGHSERVTRYAVKFAQKLKLSEKEIKKIEFACGVHDIGKINISETILNKPASLDPEEWMIMREHPNKGVEILVPLGILKELIPLVKYHHEHFDGKGYPEGLMGKAIPWEARIISLMDAYDAMTSTRPYRMKMDKETALREIEKCLGKQFDPELGEIFLAHHPALGVVEE
ncbi:MAG: response regulator [Candidatus Omnitrophica bacterium]|nr:response regulator [Candidatus Omnitrophota bacterium]MCM8794059.1 response regulator [Candidatus Omnitrophota bacterium]